MIFKCLVAISLAVASASAHMTFSKPCPRFSPYANCPKPPSGLDWDWDMNGPIGSEGSKLMPLCRYTQSYSTPTETWSAGQSVTISFRREDSTGHYGGHCQFSVSYDGGKTFVVVHEELKHCFYNGPSSSDVAQVFDYSFNLPSTLPGSDHAVFAWTWINASGNREFYMNCADVKINGSAGSYTGKQMTIANYGSEYPRIPEFLGNFDAGIEYYNNAPQVTVSGPGNGN